MTTLTAIKQSELFLDPWRHKIINSFFAPEDFSVIEESAKRLEDAYRTSTITADSCLSLAEALSIIGDEAFDIILKANRVLLDNFKLLIDDFPNSRTFEDYISFPTFHVLPPNTPPQKVHDEAYDKSVSIVVYLYPTVSVGTALFLTKDRSSFVREVEWVQNTAMMFCGEENVTWHDFYSRDSTRVTLNFFLRRLKSKTLSQDDLFYYWDGVDGPGTKIPKSIPQEKIKLLTSGVLFK